MVIDYDKATNNLTIGFDGEIDHHSCNEIYLKEWCLILKMLGLWIVRALG